ncbi:ABC transporter ATP-binding protein [Pseudomonas sp.]|uniref:ABC transporter ATP-binding protein n=1 Tax=Pseudomonas sp. TaxID=306 RepID=UPI00260E3019|nr:ABC transporter ATP-binding protein [Pseudomonas sp.]
MPSNTTIEVKNLSKRYDIFHSASKRIRALLFGRRADQEYFEALKPLSFEIERGSFFGIIGQNGSGKSTLLQLICGILTPSSGSVSVQGRVAALLELGAGFNPEFTGRENARLNARILGVSGRRFEEILPEIQAFADIGTFIDQPVKLYSSGMFVRLAFAIQACIDPDVLIVDEALAVGDIFFRLKCYERLGRLRAKGCTVILVTHSMDDIMHYCDQVLLLDHGDAVYLGDATEAINRYYALGHVNARQHIAEDAARLKSVSQRIEDSEDHIEHQEDFQVDAIEWPNAGTMDMSQREQTGDGLVQCTQIALTNSVGSARQVFQQFETLKLYVEYRIVSDLDTPVAGFVIRTDRGVIVHGRNSGQCGCPVPRRVRQGQIVRVVFDIPMSLGCGEYIIDLGFATWPTELFDHAKLTSMAELEAAANRHCVLSSALNFSIVSRGHFGFQAQPFYGIAAVDSSARLSIVR